MWSAGGNDGGGGGGGSGGVAGAYAGVGGVVGGGFVFVSDGAGGSCNIAMHEPDKIG